MIKIPYEDIINKISEQSKLSKEEIEERIHKKTSQLSGLVSKEGAAHIVANELGVKILDGTSGKLQIKNIMAGMRSVETVGRVLQAFDIKDFMTENRSGKVGSMVIGDETSTIRVVMWGEQADNLKKLKQDDIVKVVSGYVRENNGRKEIHLNERSKLIINPPNESVGEIKKPKASRKSINELTETDSNVELMGTIVQVFEPRFFEICPECRRRAKQKEGRFMCDEHGFVTPNYSYVLNVFLDDGTENIRVVSFGKQAEQMLGKNYDEMLAYKNFPEKFEEVKTALLGNVIKCTGRTTKNTMFDRLEFISQNVVTEVNPEEEIKRLNDEMNDAKK